jgi:hypothetical protein
MAFSKPDGSTGVQGEQEKWKKWASADAAMFPRSQRMKDQALNDSLRSKLTE